MNLEREQGRYRTVAASVGLPAFLLSGGRRIQKTHTAHANSLWKSCSSFGKSCSGFGKSCSTVALLCALAMLLAVRPARGQNVTATVTGTVRDSAGAAMAGATVTATDLQFGTSQSVQTNHDGVYVLTQLRVGRYTVQVESSGFSTYVHPPFTLVLNQTARLDFTMAVGKTSQTVRVTGAPPLLQTDSTELGTIINARANVTLPLATRNYNQLTLLSPGAVSPNPGSFTGAQTTFQSGRPYINGNREQTNNYILDGMDNNQIDNNDVAYAPSVDAIQEFNLISQNAPASFGNYLGGVVSVTLKSGTNQFHGDAFEFIRNDVFNANTWGNNLFGAPKATLRWNEFGGTVGGPIIKNKLFFFADYQGSRFDQPGTSVPFTVFTAAERTGNFADFCPEGFAGGLCVNPAHQLYNPKSSATVQGRAPFLNNVIDPNLFSKAASAILNSPLYPEPTNNLTTGNQINFTHSYTDSDQGDIRVDWIASQKDHIYGRYSQQGVVNPTTNSQQLLGNSSNNYPLYNGVASWSRAFSSSLVNEVRGGGSYFPVFQGFSNPTGQNLPATFGIGGATPGVDFLPQINISGGFVNGIAFGSNDLLSEFFDTVIQAEDELTYIHGRHTLHAGFQFFRYDTKIFYPGNEGLAGQFFFTGQFTGNGTPASPGMGEADFLLGLPQQLGQGAGAGFRDLRNNLVAAYVQDDWRAAPNLTINAGLRWEVNTPRTEASNQLTNYGLTSGQVMLAGQNGASDALYNQYNGRTNFQPRLGAAYQLDPYTVLRGAYGISNFTESTGTGNLLFQNAPWAIPHNIINLSTQALPSSTLDQGFTQFPVSGCTDQAALASSPACFSGATIHAFDPNDVRPAVSQQYNLTLQHQIGDATTFQIGYVGQKTDHLAAVYLISQGVLNPNGTVSASPFLAGNPALQHEIGQARLTQSSGFSNYNALQASVQHRLANGLEAQLNFTWSKCMTNSSGFFAEFGDTNPGLTQSGNDYFFVQNTYDPKADYGLCPNNVADDFNGFITYNLPVGRGQQFGGGMNRAVDAAIGGWQVNAILNFHTGFPVTAQANDQSGTGSGFPRADCSGPPIQTPYKPASPGPGYQWLDPNSVSQPSAGTFGTCSVGSFRGPGLSTADVSLTKTFPIVGSQNIEFRAEAINVTNTPILIAPADRVGPTFGLIQTSQGARNLQFAVKYHF